MSSAKLSACQARHCRNLLFLCWLRLRWLLLKLLRHHERRPFETGWVDLKRMALFYAILVLGKDILWRNKNDNYKVVFEIKDYVLLFEIVSSSRCK